MAEQEIKSFKPHTTTALTMLSVFKLLSQKSETRNDFPAFGLAEFMFSTFQQQLWSKDQQV